ncbi:glycosyltransferase family 2 protein [Jiangella alkaliphila]|uniref:Glycosyltransferase, catalytic subunit of cellulose synthase and poly-beta-1,6-N-acetylglucosamine synthase n=1 Tax=Jiangella alkaliphila TaxID=419479 RepID=A0A1H2L1M7_9ACTN|nr:glycosyltransferase family 2 protein [Jiangella alkaliphila]SDU74712.1 Glycosyltransferase, catalytic subunit of cellulose synthase and poly-beta-1,6-N-acetylglucosamine synthase [Jiangella alkaliphila]
MPAGPLPGTPTLAPGAATAPPPPPLPAPRHQHEPRRVRQAGFPWWLPNVGVAAAAATLFAVVVGTGVQGPSAGTTAWWLLTASMHLPVLLIAAFLAGGVIERLGYFWRGRAPERPGRLPYRYPSVCVQLPMFNEHAVARRAIEAACALRWPSDRLTVQVLDDSTDGDTRALVDAVCARLRWETGVDVRVLRRPHRHGYKAGALEAGRRLTDAEFIAIFDADFLPPRDYLLRAIPHFFRPDGVPDHGLALVQAQWGHLNHDESALTRAQSLWVDDHHTLQMSWRSAMWRFVNFTGTAGVWRAASVEAAGGWRAASLVEDCELSFRHLFAGYRTKFVKEIVAPAELPATYTAYKAQQKRWTQGWVQVQRLHLGTLLFRHRASLARRAHLVYHMCTTWQWPLWAVWITVLPALIHSGLWFGALGAGAGLALYVLPSLLWLTLVTSLASAETRHTYPERTTPSVFRRRFTRIVPYLVVNTGMLPHQFSAFTEGLFGPLHSEFERTPKAGEAGRAATERRRDRVKVHWPYVAAELFCVAYQLAWAGVFLAEGLWWCALGAGYVAVCVASLLVRYGDHAGKVLFVLDAPRRLTRSRRAERAPAPAA